MDEDFNATLLCLDSFWQQPEKILKTDRIAVCIPAKNLLLLTDMRNLESLISMRVIAAKMYERATGDGTAITSNTYIRKNGQWILFLDTEEQVNELLR